MSENVVENDPLFDEPEVPKRGAPTKYNPEFGEQLIEHMKAGVSFDSFAGRDGVRVCAKTLYNWMRAYPEFQQARKIGEQVRLLTLERLGLNITHTGKGNGSTWMFFMKNSYGWRDRLEVQNEDPAPQSSDKRDSRQKEIGQLQALLAAKKMEYENE